MKKKVLVCGASGFIGRNLFEALSKRLDLDVYGTYLSREFLKSRKLIKTDLTNKEWARTVTRGMDIVINTAAITDGSGAVTANPIKYIADNNRINTNIIESVHENGVSNFVLLSCSILYPEKNASPVKEGPVDLSKIHPKYFMFAQLKVFAEDMCKFYSELGKTRFTVVRHSNIYGPYDKFSVRGHVFAATVAKIMSPKNERVVVWGDGHESRDLLHVYDLVRFFEMILNYGNRYDVFNVGSGCSISIKELVDKINLISGKNLPVHYETTKPVIDTNIVLDITKTWEILGWQPKIDIDEGIRQTIEWYKSNIQEGGR